MSYYVKRTDVVSNNESDHQGCKLLDEKNGCVNGCYTGISYYTSTEYSPNPGVHEDQEGFYAIEGTGWAKIGDEEFRIEPDISFIAPAGVPHTLKRDPDSVPIKVFWFHSAI